ncbi:MAG: tetratricopeptide repeat protein [Bacteriovoracaceae bacterium]|nr:tetratricopeptide repeat protein [Bacteriovoracaceae bacterium]
MKRISIKDPQKGLFFISIQSIAVIITIMILASSCSWITSKRSLFGDSSDADSKLQTVPKAQYDQLKEKYETLLEGSRSQPKLPGDDTLANTKNREKELFENKNPEDIVNELNKLEPGMAENSSAPELVETVDVFGKGLSKPSGSSSSSLIASDYDNVDVHGQIEQLQKAKLYLRQNKMDSALNEFKLLENSPVRQIKVRAKFNIGELLFRQGEFDLALQVYEEILHKDAFSGIVIKTLGRLIACSEKLKLKKKQEQYYSILHDFFEES